MCVCPHVSRKGKIIIYLSDHKFIHFGRFKKLRNVMDPSLWLFPTWWVRDESYGDPSSIK